MPIYTYFRDSTEEFIDLVQTMNEVHEYSGKNGLEDDWRRIYFSPQMSIDTKINPFSPKEFTDRTGSKKGTVGDMLDYSSEMSDKRAEQAGGIDPVKEKYFKEYSEKRRGAKHQNEKKSFETKNVSVDFS